MPIDYAAHLTRMEALRAERLAARWAGQGLRPDDCAIPWPPSLDDVQTLHCQLRRGHGGPHWSATPWSSDHTLEW